MSNKTMRQARFEAKGGKLVLADNVPIPEPKAGEVRVKVYACGICHSDTFTAAGVYGNEFPRAPGHEAAGEVDAVGEGVHGFKKGDKVGVGWFGGHCGECANCKKNVWVSCEKGKICGISYDGGYGEYLVAPHDALVRLPAKLDHKLAGPLLCAGITTFNSLRNAGAKAGAVCVVIGVGGLGHLGIQFASQMGFQTVAVSRGSDKAELAKKLGAHHYVDSESTDPVKFINELGGADIILATAPSTKATQQLLPSLALNGQLLVVAILDKPLEVDTLSILNKRGSIRAWAAGDSRDSEDTVNFSVVHNIAPMIEEFPLDKAVEAFDRMMSTKAKFRCVIVHNH